MQTREEKEKVTLLMLGASNVLWFLHSNVFVSVQFFSQLQYFNAHHSD